MAMMKYHHHKETYLVYTWNLCSNHFVANIVVWLLLVACFPRSREKRGDCWLTLDECSIFYLVRICGRVAFFGLSLKET